jgi:hypothetical protein
MTDSLTLDLSDLEPDAVALILRQVRELRGDAIAIAGEVAADWKQAVSTGWTYDTAMWLRRALRERGAEVQLKAFDRAIENGGFVSRAEVYALGGYAANRQLKNWTSPVSSAQKEVQMHSALPETAAPAMVTNYGAGKGFRPAKGFDVAPEIVKLIREN